MPLFPPWLFCSRLEVNMPTVFKSKVYRHRPVTPASQQAEAGKRATNSRHAWAAEGVQGQPGQTW